MWNLILSDANGSTFWLPQRASTVAGGADALFNAILWICVFFFALVTVLLVLFVIKYRHRPGVERDTAGSHSMALEATWTIIPTIIVVFLYYYGFKHYLRMNVEPPNAYEITAHAQMWQWSFEYPNGYSDPELHVAVNTPVRMVLESADVIHSLFVPVFRVKKDVVPGRYNRLWFEATEPGTFDIYCAAYCGTNHSAMRSHVIVHRDQADFDRWLADATAKADNLPPLEKGRKLYVTKGCAQCHSIDGSRITGPSWKDVFGSMQPMTDGSQSMVDEAFVHAFVRNPQAKVPMGYSPVMPPFPASLLSEGDVDALIAFMKSISVHAPKNDSLSTKIGKLPATAPAIAPVGAPGR